MCPVSGIGNLGGNIASFMRGRLNNVMTLFHITLFHVIKYHDLELKLIKLLISLALGQQTGSPESTVVLSQVRSSEDPALVSVISPSHSVADVLAHAVFFNLLVRVTAAIEISIYKVKLADRR